MITDERIANGKPAEIADVVEEMDFTTGQAEVWEPVPDIPKRTIVLRTSTPVTMSWVDEPDFYGIVVHSVHAEIALLSLPGEKTLLRLSTADENWPEIKPLWDELLAELERLQFYTPTEQTGQTKEELPIPEGKTQTDERKGAKHEPLHCNRWLFVEYFDNQRDPKGLVEEWLKIREEQDFKDPPLYPLKSMRTAISEERERRQESGIVRNDRNSYSCLPAHATVGARRQRKKWENNSVFTLTNGKPKG